jgi:hypothetical protein
VTTTTWPASTLLLALDSSGQYQSVTGITTVEARRLYTIAWSREGFGSHTDSPTGGHLLLPARVGAYEQALSDLQTIRS